MSKKGLERVGKESFADKRQFEHEKREFQLRPTTETHSFTVAVGQWRGETTKLQVKDRSLHKIRLYCATYTKTASAGKWWRRTERRVSHMLTIFCV